MFLLFVIILVIVITIYNKKKYRELETEVLQKLGFASWDIISYIDEDVTVKSRQHWKNMMT